MDNQSTVEMSRKKFFLYTSVIFAIAFAMGMMFQSGRDTVHAWETSRSIMDDFIPDVDHDDYDHPDEEYDPEALMAAQELCIGYQGWRVCEAFFAGDASPEQVMECFVSSDYQPMNTTYMEFIQDPGLKGNIYCPSPSEGIFELAGELQWVEDIDDPIIQKAMEGVDLSYLIGSSVGVLRVLRLNGAVSEDFSDEKFLGEMKKAIEEYNALPEETQKGITLSSESLNRGYGTTLGIYQTVLKTVKQYHETMLDDLNEKCAPFFMSDGSISTKIPFECAELAGNI